LSTDPAYFSLKRPTAAARVDFRYLSVPKTPNPNPNIYPKPKPQYISASVIVLSTMSTMSQLHADEMEEPCGASCNVGVNKRGGS